MKRSPLRKQSKSPIATIKKSIQAKVRAIVMKRDGVCILRKFRHCTHTTTQADHLITRANSGTFADTRLIVALCKSCHGGYKQWHKDKYDAQMKTILPPKIVKLWEQKEKERTMGMTTQMTLSDWKLAEIALDMEMNDVGLEVYTV